MSDLHIQRDHHLGLPRAREVARAWARKAEEKFDMECTYEEGKTADVVLTEKDAVKLRPEAVGSTRVWVAPLDFRPDAGFAGALRALCERLAPTRAPSRRLPR